MDKQLNRLFLIETDQIAFEWMAPRSSETLYHIHFKLFKRFKYYF